MQGFIARVRSYWRGLRKPAELDADMADEMRFHIEMESQRLVKTRGLDADEARRRAALAFGGVEKYRGAGRDALGFTAARGLSVDLKLGLRMLARSPGLTLVALFALTLAIGAGAGYLEFTRDMFHGRLPFPGGDRVVGIQNWDQQTGDLESRLTLEFARWHESLTTIDDLGAYRPLNRSLITEDGRAEPVRGVAITAAAFRIAGVPPLHGRPLQTSDDQPGAPAVLVLGHDVFTGRFNADPLVIGSTVKLGGDAYTVVGVMPPGFAFPVNHSLWVPLALDDNAPQPRGGGAIRIFGKLAPGATLQQAQAEVTASALQLAREFPDTHRHLRPAVRSYITSMWSAADDSTMQRIVIYAANLFFIGLLALCGANVATLVFARTVTREAEISVRTALGASRARIVGQLIVEAFVLTSIATMLGLGFAYYGLQWVKQTIAAGMGSPVWFWWNDRLSPESVAYALLLAAIAALIVGGIPGLKATGAHIQDRLKHGTGGSTAGLRFGGVWTGVIVLQVGVTVVFLAVVTTLAWGLFFQNAGDRPLTIAGDRYVTMRLNVDREAPLDPGNTEAQEAHRRLLRSLYERFAERVAAEPGVRGIGFGSRLPSMNHLLAPVELDGTGRVQMVRNVMVSPDLLSTLQARLVAGRLFTNADAAPGRHVAIVDRTFVRTVLGGGTGVGERIRAASRTEENANGRSYVNRPGSGPWIEIIGVVDDLTADHYKRAADAVMYLPAHADTTWPLYTAVHVAGDTAAMMWRLRVIAAETDPALRLDEVQTLDQVTVADRVAIEFFLRLLAGIGVVALVLATAGVYALMSFTVARRTTEIGIRLALGANPRRIVVATFARALAQVGAGVLIGSIPAVLLAVNLGPEFDVSASTVTAAVICALAAGTTMVITAFACVPPARRALRIQPVDTLKTT
jgi:putative ABC transport system permease protein